MGDEPGGEDTTHVQVGEWRIAELQIKPNQNHLLKNLEGSIFAWLVGCLVITLATVLMLLWPLKMFKLSKL